MGIVTGKLATTALLMVLVAACGPSAGPRLETSPSAAIAVGAASPTQAPTTFEGTPTGRDIYVVASETGQATLALSGRGSQTNAEASPDGRRVVFESRAHGAPSQIVVLEADGTKRKLTQMVGGASDPTWSPDGKQIAFAATRSIEGSDRPDADIFVMNADGSHIRRLAGTARPDGHPDWSPDGSRIAFHSRSGWTRQDLSLPIGLIWLVSVRTGALTHLTPHHYPYGEVDPEWSPDGRWIAFSRFPRSTINGETPWAGLWLMRPNGTHRIGIRKSDRKTGSYDSIEDPSWSPNGHSIVVDARGIIAIIDLATERRTVLTEADGAEPSWGADGILVSFGASIVPSLDTPATATWEPTWEPSWVGRPDATIVLTGSSCEQEGGADVLDPGVLAIRFVNDSFLEGLFRVVRLASHERPGDLWDTPPYLGRRSSTFIGPSTTEIWSSSREITSGKWAVVCWKDLIAASNGWQMKGVGIVGPIEVRR